jgi:glycosyltransferase involved in cell wall biosynthesis
MDASPPPLLSICISTFNRAAFIGETLRSILPQVSAECEVIVLDSSVADDTRDVVLDVGATCSQMSYFRNDADNGQDDGFDKAVSLARGQYCWLIPDDDLMNPGAVDQVLRAMRGHPSLIVINIACKTFAMTEFVLQRWLTLDSNVLYKPEDFDRLCIHVGDLFMYLGCVVIRRDIWLARERKRYYNSMFMHVAVILQRRLPGDTVLLADPLITYRAGNAHSYSSKSFEIYMLNWPSIIWSSALSEEAKRQITHAEPWRSALELARLRGLGHYTWNEYRRWIRPRLRKRREAVVPMVMASLPGVLVNTFLLICYSIGGYYRQIWVRGLKDSPFYLFRQRDASSSRLETQ